MGYGIKSATPIHAAKLHIVQKWRCAGNCSSCSQEASGFGTSSVFGIGQHFWVSRPPIFLLRPGTFRFDNMILSIRTQHWGLSPRETFAFKIFQISKQISRLIVLEGFTFRYINCKRTTWKSSSPTWSKELTILLRLEILLQGWATTTRKWDFTKPYTHEF